MIFVTGDIHGDITRFKAAAKAHIKKKDVLFVCGDFGFLWEGTNAEYKKIKWIGKRRYKTIFVDGYNENHSLINDAPLTEIFGGKARQLSGNLYCANRGEIFDIDGVRVFAFGGTDSLPNDEGKVNDIFSVPTANEMQTASENLAKYDDTVDLIITHDVPARLKNFIDMESHEITNLHTFLEDICQTVKFKQWYFGKYHSNKKIPPCYNMIFTAVTKYE